MNLRTQPNERRCAETTVSHQLSVPQCCPVTKNPQPGSSLEIGYVPQNYMIEVASLRGYIDSFVGGRGDVRSMEGMVQKIAQDCADCILVQVSVIAALVLEPDQRMAVACIARPRRIIKELLCE